MITNQQDQDKIKTFAGQRMMKEEKGLVERTRRCKRERGGRGGGVILTVPSRGGREGRSLHPMNKGGTMEKGCNKNIVNKEKRD